MYLRWLFDLALPIRVFHQTQPLGMEVGSMDWDKFWREQLVKNQDGMPVYSVTTDPDTPADDFMRMWIERWHCHFHYFNNAGCGCCVNIYEFDVPKAAIAELPADLIEVEL